MSGRDHSYRQAEDVPQRTVRDSEQQAAVRRIAEPILGSLGLVLVDVEIRGRGQRSSVRLIIERPSEYAQAVENVTLEDCEKAHVLIGHAIDIEDPIPHSYVLEVSSPGLDRPIRSASDYQRFVGRLARFKLTRPYRGQAVVIGRIHRLEGGAVWIKPVSGGRQSRTEEPPILLPLGDIQQARLEVEF
jgi:ribosome maturation factor RimP